MNKTIAMEALGNRHEKRIQPRFFVKIKPAERNGEKTDAITADISDAGVAFYTYLPIEVGTKIEINLGGELAAKGEIVNVDEWACYGLIRLGVRFMEKSEKWPL